LDFVSFKEFFEEAGVGMTCVSLDGVLVDVNQKFCDMLGYRQDEVIGRPIKDITHPDDYGVGARFRAEVAQGEVEAVSSEKRFIRKDGSLIWVNHATSLARGQNGEPTHLITVTEDISERKQAEDALRASEETLRATFRQAGVGIFITSPDRRYLQVNDKYCDMLGYTREELLQMSSANVLPPEAVGAVQANRNKLIRGELQTVIHERQLLRKDGSLIWVNHATSLARGPDGEPTHLITVAEDISERKQAEDALRASEETLRATFRQAGVGIFITSPDRRYLQVNDKYCDMLGYTREELLQMSSADVLPPEAVGAVQANRNKLMLGELQTVSHERQLLRKDGSLIWVNHATSLARGQNGEPTHLITVAEDISERKRAEERLTQLAHYDVLTSLPNRMLFFDRLKHALAEAKRNHSRAAMMFVDLDRFKNINDTLGHAAGDDLLQQVAERLKESVRASDTVGRLGGDEFAVVLSNLATAGDADAAARKIIARFSEPFRLTQAELFVTASIGIALYPDDSTDQDALIKNADIAMYRAKEEGRNTYAFFSPGMNAQGSERLNMEVMLRRALERKEFVLHYQPKIALQGSRIVGVEALIRWNSKELGPVLPMQFIPLAEETGLIAPIGAWVLKTACAQNKAWQDQGLPPLLMSVNLSPRQFQQKNLVQMIAGTLAETGLDPRSLELEITESMIMQHPEKSSAILQQLHEIGVQLSIDDFGTGYLSFANPKRFPVRRLKIEQSLVRDITTDADDAAIVTAVIGMAKSLKLEVVAEGVETREQFALLAQLRCDEYQGYYFSKPLPAEEFVRLL